MVETKVNFQDKVSYFAGACRLYIISICPARNISVIYLCQEEGCLEMDNIWRFGKRPYFFVAKRN